MYKKHAIFLSRNKIEVVKCSNIQLQVEGNVFWNRSKKNRDRAADTD